MRLVVLLSGRQVGWVDQGTDGRLRFTYDDSWREARDSFPLSLSMPLSSPKHKDRVIRPFLEGLLPDNPGVLERWGREFQVSPRNPFSLLSHMGEDCAGALQLVRPERLPELEATDAGTVDWLSDSDIGVRLKDAVSSSGTGRLAGDKGRFSLAGAQPKTALYFDGLRWGIPSGRLATTHILKPSGLADLDGFTINEHFCLRLAKQLGLPAASSFVRDFDGEGAIVVERYDRAIRPPEGVVRLHQEDVGQALAASPAAKYENEGGPGASDVVNLLVRESSDPSADVGSFMDALSLNWAIAGTDAHAKNYSVLISAERVRLAPLYDVISALPYPDQILPRKRKLAMRVGTEYTIRKIGRRHWEGLAARCELDAEPVVRRVGELVSVIADAAKDTAQNLRDDGLIHPVVGRLEEAIQSHSQKCLKRLKP